MIDLCLADFRYAWRRVLGRPASSGLVVLILALGIGLSGTAFAAAWGILWRGLDVVQGERLVRLAIRTDQGVGSLPWDVYADLREKCRACEQIEVWLALAVDVGGLDLYPERLNGAQVSAGALEILGVEPMLGRFFTEEEERTGAPVVVVGERLWREQLGASPDALGRMISVYRRPVRVIGVVQEEVRAPYNQELWTPISAGVAGRSPWMQAIARLEDGATAESLRQELGHYLEAQGVEAEKAVVESFEQAYQDETLRHSLHLVLAAVLLVFLVASANAAGLLVSRGLEREEELAIRRALGADRLRLLRLQALEIALLAALSGMAGVFLAALGLRLYSSIGSIQGPYWIDLRLDGAVLVFIVGTTLIGALAAGLLPAWLGSRASLLRTGRGATTARSTQAWQQRLVVLQIALGTALSAGAWWLAAAAEELGGPLEPLLRDDVVVLQGSTYGSEHAASREANELYWRRVLAELEALPEVRAAAIGPVPGFHSRLSVRRETGDEVSFMRRPVTPGAFEILGVPRVAGRDFRPEEADSTDVVVVDTFVAESLFEGEALGSLLRWGDAEARVIGVVQEITVPSGSRGAVYTPAFADRRTAHTVAMQLESAHPPAGFERSVRSALTRVDPLAAAYWVETLRHWMEHQLRHTWSLKVHFVVFAAVTVLLSGLGLYGALVLFVASRRRELAIRNALGASISSLRRLVLTRGLRGVLMGIAVGALLATVLFRALGTVFGDVTDPWSMGVRAAVTLGLCGLVASWWPARQAGAVEPAQGLRQD